MVVWEDVTLRGFVKRVSTDYELRRNNRARGGYYFLWVDYYKLNDKKEKGRAKVYISTESLGLGRSKGIVYYPTNDLNHPEREFRTAIVNPSRLIDERIGLIGKMKREKTKDHDIFVSYLKKLKIFPDPKTYLK